LRRPPTIRDGVENLISFHYDPTDFRPLKNEWLWNQNVSIIFLFFHTFLYTGSTIMFRRRRRSYDRVAPTTRHCTPENPKSREHRRRGARAHTYTCRRRVFCTATRFRGRAKSRICHAYNDNTVRCRHVRRYRGPHRVNLQYRYHMVLRFIRYTRYTRYVHVRRKRRMPSPSIRLALKMIYERALERATPIRYYTACAPCTSPCGVWSTTSAGGVRPICVLICTRFKPILLLTRADGEENGKIIIIIKNVVFTVVARGRFPKQSWDTDCSKTELAPNFSLRLEKQLEHNSIRR